MSNSGSAAPRHVVVMGVSSTGKTLIGGALATKLPGTLVEGDSFHPQANIDKMAAGQPLDDDDRKPWLQALAQEIKRLDEAGETGVVACSALRRVYRDWLREGVPDIFFVHLHSDFDILSDRMTKREGHFMPPSLLQSQFDTLEPLHDDELGVQVDVRVTPQEVYEAALAALAEAGLTPHAEEGRDPGEVWRP